MLWGRIVGHWGCWRDGGFCRGKVDTLTRVQGWGKGSNPRARLQAFMAAGALLGLLGEHWLTGCLNWGGGGRRESRGCREICSSVQTYIFSQLHRSAVPDHIPDAACDGSWLRDYHTEGQKSCFLLSFTFDFTIKLPTTD